MNTIRGKKNILGLLLCCLICLTSISQMRYEDLDKYSKTISEIQFRAQPFYTAADKVTFPEENFKVFFSTKKAALGFYSEDQSGEDLCIYDEIDFARVKSIFFTKDRSGAEYISIVLTTPKTMKVIKGEHQRTVENSTLFFYYKNGSEPDKQLLFDNLSQLILLFKNNDNPAAKEKLEGELRAWAAVQKQNNYSAYKAFTEKYPNSIFASEAAARMAQLRSGKSSKDYNLSEYHIGMTKAEFEKIYAEGMSRIQVNKKDFPFIQEIIEHPQFAYENYKDFYLFKPNFYSDQLYPRIRSMHWRKANKYLPEFRKVEDQAGTVILKGFTISGYNRGVIDRVYFSSSDNKCTRFSYDFYFPTSFSSFADMKQQVLKFFGEPDSDSGSSGAGFNLKYIFDDVEMYIAMSRWDGLTGDPVILTISMAKK